MKLAFLLEKLEEEELYKEFKKKYPHSFLYAGFFMFDTDKNQEEYHLDFFIPGINKVATIAHPFKEIKIQPDEVKNVKPLALDLQIDIDNIKEKIEEIKKYKECNKKTSKIVAVLQDNVWGITCISPTLDILRMNICSTTGECQKFDLSDFREFMKINKK